ncbi:MAG: TRAP transporter small permease, partial [Dehalococcoidia bacterium]
GFDISYAWYEHVIILMLVWSIFILVGSSTRRDDHIIVGFFIEKIAGSEERARRIRTVLDTVIGLGISTFLVWALYRWAAYSHSLGSLIYITGTGYYAEWIRRVPVVVGIGLVSFFYLERFIKLLVLLIGSQREIAMGSESEKDGANQYNGEVSGLPRESIKGDGKET